MPEQIVTSWQTYERYLIVNSSGEGRVVSSLTQAKVGQGEVAFALKIMVPKSRIPLPAGQILLKMPELQPAGIEVTVEESPVKLGLPHPHVFAPADLNDTVCRRCGMLSHNQSHKCVAPECRQAATLEVDGVPYCGTHNPLERESTT